MVMSMLPWIGTPSINFFHTLDVLAIALVCVVIAGAVLFNLLASYSLVILYHMCYDRCYSENTRQHQFKRCRCMKNTFLCVGRLLCVQTFPALFKMHKTRSDHGSQTREFMVFLDRSMENSLILVTAFCSIVCSSTTKVFLRYFTVEVSRECLEKDSHGQSLFCYLSNSIASLKNSSLPVDCANFSLTELREFQFQCYAIAPPTSLGIAVAATLGLAKVVIVGVTIFVKVTDGFLKLTKNPPWKLQKCVVVTVSAEYVPF